MFRFYVTYYYGQLKQLGCENHGWNQRYLHISHSIKQRHLVSLTTGIYLIGSPPLRHDTSSLRVYTQFILGLAKVKTNGRVRKFLLCCKGDFFGWIIWYDLLLKYCRAVRWNSYLPYKTIDYDIQNSIKQKYRRHYLLILR